MKEVEIQFTVSKSYINKNCKESKVKDRLCRRNNLVSNQTTCLPCKDLFMALNMLLHMSLNGT